MNNRGGRGQFGRHQSTPKFVVRAVTLIAAIAGSVWPLRARSVSPPFDTREHLGADVCQISESS